MPWVRDFRVALPNETALIIKNHGKDRHLLRALGAAGCLIVHYCPKEELIDSQISKG